MSNLQKTTTQDRIYFELLEMRKRLDQLIVDYQATLPNQAKRKFVPYVSPIDKKGDRKKNV